MASQDRKKKNSILLFAAAFAGVMVLMFIANYRSALEYELRSPETGVKKFSTYGNQLIAISPNNDIYTFDWDSLSLGPKTGGVNAQKAAAMSGDRLLWIPQGMDNTLTVSNLKGDKELSRLSLDLDKKCKLLQTSQNGRYAVMALAVEGPGKQIQLATIASELTSIDPVETKSMEEGLKLYDIGISNDGTTVAAVGGNDKGYLLVAGTNSSQIRWEQYVEDCNELNKVVISPDGQMVYASESGRWVYVFDTSTKKLVKRLEIDKYKTPENNPQTITCITLSCDGRLLAAVSSPISQVWIWDSRTGEKVVTMKTGQFATSSIVFSPDSSLLAAADYTLNPINVWRISEK